MASAGRRRGRHPRSQLAYMLDGIDWRNPRHTCRPSARIFCDTTFVWPTRQGL